MRKYGIIGIITIGLIISSHIALRAQDPTFSQFFNARLYTNPAFAGIDKGLRCSSIVREQWMKVPSAFQTSFVSVDVQDLNLSGGLGLTYTSDFEGEGRLKTNTVGFIYTYKLIVIPKIMDIQTGFQTDYTIKSIDWSNLQFSDQFNPIDGMIYNSSATPPDNSSKSFVDFHAGTIVRFQTKIRNQPVLITAGYANHHMTQPNESILGQNQVLPMKHTIHFSSMIPCEMRNLKAYSFIIPNFIYETQNEFHSLNAGVMYLKKPIVVGLSYRNYSYALKPNKSDAFIFQVGLKDFGTKKFKYYFMYSYDQTVSSLKSYTSK